jgi:hypothetical protein
MAIADCTQEMPASLVPSEAESPAASTVSKAVRFLTVCRGNPGERVLKKSECGVVPPVPLLRIQGQWMEQAGFEIGKRVRVHIAPGRLVFDVE